MKKVLIVIFISLFLFGCSKEKTIIVNIYEDEKDEVVLKEQSTIDSKTEVIKRQKKRIKKLLIKM